MIQQGFGDEATSRTITYKRRKWFKTVRKVRLQK